MMYLLMAEGSRRATSYLIRRMTRWTQAMPGVDTQGHTAIAATPMPTVESGGNGARAHLIHPPNALYIAEHGGPLPLPIDLIDEDPQQPRTEDNPGFSHDSLHELAASIRLRGVKTPVSVRNSLDAPGRFIINHGARRLRASRQAGKAWIPGFIDNDYNEADQVVENLQRNALTAREIADFIGRELAKGFRKGEVAQKISKSAAFVTQHAVLLDLPDPIAVAFNSGRVKDVTVINELVKACKRKPKDVAAWLRDENQEITRGSVRLLRAFLEDKLRQARTDGENGEAGEGGSEMVALAVAGERMKRQDTDTLHKAYVLVGYLGRIARLNLKRSPTLDGFAWLRYEDDGQEVEADLAQVSLLALRGTSR